MIARIWTIALLLACTALSGQGRRVRMNEVFLNDDTQPRILVVALKSELVLTMDEGDKKIEHCMPEFLVAGRRMKLLKPRREPVPREVLTTYLLSSRSAFPRNLAAQQAARLSRRLLLHGLPLATVVRFPGRDVAAAADVAETGADIATAAAEVAEAGADIAAVAAEVAETGADIAEVKQPLPTLSYIDPLFGRLRCRYILMRPGETTFEAADIVDSNPINKQSSERGLTSKGREQVRRSVEALRQRGITSCTIFYDNGARATETADIISSMLDIPRSQVEPEFRWLEARGLGEFEGSELREANDKMRKMDSQSIDAHADATDDGTPADSVLDVFSRLRNTISKIENSYGGGDFLIIGGDSTVLSVFAAAACGVDLSTHYEYTLKPGEFFDLRELQAEVRAGRYVARVVDQAPTTAAEIQEARKAIGEMGSRMFSDTDAGSWVLGSGRR